MARPPTTYWDYIKVEELLGLQSGIAAGGEAELGNDEVMFIVVHQIDELWFKLVLRELIAVRNLFAAAPVPEQALSDAVRGFRRMAVIFGKLAQHFALMETMTTRDYLAFRDKLSPASGFQSAQLREIEILMGLRDADRIALGHEHGYMKALRAPDGGESSAWTRVAERLNDLPTLRDALDAWLARTPIHGSTPDGADDAARVDLFIESYLDAHAREVRRAQDLATFEGRLASDAARLAERYDKEIEGARSF